MGLVRRATDGDAAEVLRLRQVMIDSLAGTPGATDWHAASLPTLAAELADPGGRFAAFVVELPGRPGTLAALAAGTLEYRIGRPGNPHGLIGYIFSVATDPDARRRGYGRACVEELLDWFRERGAGYVMLTASPDAEPLYASLGFTRDTDPSMRLLLGPA
ncbi:GNAT family N-acetyltransferase [Streptomyces sp. NPDC008159]|uniref:GNAT family N-acetyltransferase n=1 Tax=Streptomyces sp. NPDC008159 TaxID=3364817 RepID=UPI0036EEB642